MNILLTTKNLKHITSDYELIIFKNIKNLENKTILEKDSYYEKNKFYFSFEDKKIYLNIKKINKEDLKIRFANLTRELLKYKIKSLKFDTTFKDEVIDFQAIVEGLYLGSYEFLKYLDKEQKNIDVTITCFNIQEKYDELNEKLQEIKIICDSVNFARDIVNTPPQDYYPKSMADDAVKLSKIEDLTCKVFEEDDLTKMELNAINAVSRASENKAKLIHLHYSPKDALKTIVLLGKGVTYDTGGMSLKRGDGMVSMKCDKAGAITVLGIIKTIAELKLPIQIHAVVGAVENMIDSPALVPGDVIKIGQKFVEITNTDAEGRLVLADCILYANKHIEDFDYIFDFATLTGASINCFGGYSSVIISENKKLIKDIYKSSKNSGELVSLMEINRYMNGRLKSDVADIVNSPANKNASSMIGAMFLKEFFEKKNIKKWMHFDMAGPSFRREIWGVNPYGASGYGIRLMIDFIKNLINKEKEEK